MPKTKTLWSIVSGAVGAILFGGTMIPTVVCGCLPAEESFLHLLREPGTKRIHARLIDRESLLERQSLGTPYENFIRDRGIVSRLNLEAQCSPHAADSEIECIIRTEASWFEAVERHKRVRFRFGSDRRLSDVSIDSYVQVFGRRFDG